MQLSLTQLLGVYWYSKSDN